MRNEVIKHSAAIQISNKLTLLQRRLYNVLLANAYAELPYADTHNADLDDVCKTLCYESKNIGHLKTSLKDLMSTVVEWNVFGKKGVIDDWKASTLLAHVGLTNGVFTYSYSPYLREKLYNPEVYAKISLSLQNDFKSRHSLAVYETLLDYYDHRKPLSRTPYITILEFRNLLAIAPSKYKDFKVLKRDIINKVVDEINDVSDIFIEVLFKRVGRSIGKMQFTIKRNPKNSMPINALPAAKQPTLPDKILDIDNQDLLKILVEKYGVKLKSAASLLEQYDEFQIKENLQVVEEALKAGKISQNVAGYVVNAITNNYRPNLSTSTQPDKLTNKKKLAQELLAKEEQKRIMKEVKTVLTQFSKFDTEKQNFILSEFENTLPALVKKSFIADGRDISSPKYSVNFLYYVNDNNEALKWF